MNNTVKYILALLVFLLSGVVGYVGASKLRGRGNETEKSTTVTVNPAPVQPVPEVEPEPRATIVIQSVDTPTMDPSSGKYTFTVNATGDGLRFLLYDDSERLITEQESGKFAVPPVPGGKYYVRVTDIHGNFTDPTEVGGCVPIPKVNKLTASEYQTIVNSGRASSADTPDFRSRVSPRVAFTFVGIEPGERKPQSTNELIMKISNGIWDSVDVQGVTYDSITGKMTGATIKVNYPE